MSSLGVKAITGKPYKPTTQGKNERFHQTLFRWLDKQPMAQSHAELQALVDRFDLIYNTERPHQGLPGRITPQQSWDATAVAEEPRPSPIPVLPDVNDNASVKVSVPDSVKDPATEAPGHGTATGPESEITLETSVFGRLSGTIAHPADTGSQKLQVYSNGVVKIGKTLFSLTKRMAARVVIAAWDTHGIVFANTDGEIIAVYAWPPEDTGGHRIRRDQQVPHPLPQKDPPQRSVTDVMRHRVSPLS